MSEPSFASLNPSLLARKGGAKPAMRPQHGTLAGIGMPADDAAPNLEDLGWNDMGEDTEVRESETVHLTPAPANPGTAAQAADMDAKAQAELTVPEIKLAVVTQLETLESRLAKPFAAAKAKSVRKTGKLLEPVARTAEGKRTAFTLRLDAQRHLKLRLATAIKGRSAQSIVTEALDAMFATIEDLDALAAQVKRR